MSKYTMRFARQTDLMDIIDIDQENDPANAYNIKTLRNELHRNKCIVVADKATDCVVGFAVYSREDDGISLYKIVVDVAYRRKGIGRAIINKLRKLTNKIDILVSERADTMHYFLRAVGFKACKVVREHFGADDGYFFEVTNNLALAD